MSTNRPWPSPPREFPLQLHADFTSHRIITCTEVDATGGVCPICQEEPKDPVQTQCEHRYCRECLQTWTDGHNTCPSCRKELYSRYDIPERRLITIMPYFYDLLEYDVYDHEEVQFELEYWDTLVKENEPPLVIDDDMVLTGNYDRVQATVVAVGIWFWNKVAQDYAPHLREMFKKDWIKVIHQLDCVMFSHDQWLGPVKHLRRSLVDAVIPSEDEPRRAPADVNSWKSLEEGETWYREHGATWVSDGWQAHADRIKVMCEYLVRAQLFCMIDEWSDSDDEEDDDDDNNDGRVEDQ